MRFTYPITAEQVIWGVLWTGLVLLTVTLLVLMRTRWGQSQPLRKCVALSLLAHLLFGCYATTVGIVHSARQAAADSRIAGVITLVDDETSSIAGVPTAAPAEASEFAATIPPEPAVAAPEQPATPEVAASEQPSAANLLADEPEPVLPADPLPAEPTPTPLETEPPPEFAVSAAPSIQAPESPPVSEAEPSPPETPPLEQRPVETAEVANDAGSSPSSSLPDESPPAAPQVDAVADAPAIDSPAEQPEPMPTASTIVAAEIRSGQQSTPVSGTAQPVVEPPMPELAPAVPAEMKLRVAENRMQQVERMGGSSTSEAAVESALRWLADNQSPDGRWSASQFQAGRELRTLGQERPGAGAKADAGVTGLALLAFLGAGHTHLHGPHHETVQRGIDYLRSMQRPDGNLGGNASSYELMYCHGMATIALSEAYALTRDKQLDLPVRRAVVYTLNAQHPSTGGWRYRPGDLGDTSQLGWQLMALKSAEMAGIPIPPAARDGMLRYLRTVTLGRAGGLASYRPGELPSRTMTAEALCGKQFLSAPLREEAIDEAAAYLVEELPTADRTNVYYWYYATLALFRLQGDAWDQWNEALSAALVPQQRTEGHLAGSWDPDPVWGGYGGRVYSTALSALCLEVYYRYLPLHVEAASGDLHRLRR